MTLPLYLPRQRPHDQQADAVWERLQAEPPQPLGSGERQVVRVGEVIRVTSECADVIAVFSRWGLGRRTAMTGVPVSLATVSGPAR